ncbi:MAG: Eco57I restriction-modification methylase domain-containing protein [Candidatus Methanospirareceae archaeon]
MVDKIKTFGQYFTPRPVAEFMVNLGNKDITAKVLEPCAGKGIFLDVLWENKFRNVVAYEIDPSLPNRSPIRIEYRDFLSTNIQEKFDMIIGNPPYVRWKNIPVEVHEKLRSRSYWQNKINGLSDLLYAFIYLCVDKLEENGELIFITPIFWTQTLHAGRLRQYMCEKGDLEVLITFNEMRIFKEVSTSALIFKYVKRKTGKPIKIVHVWSKDRLTKKILDKVTELLQRLEKGEDYIKEDYFEAYLHPQFRNGKPWKPLPPNIFTMLTTIEDTCRKFSPTITVEINNKPLNLPLSKLLEGEDLEELGIYKNTCKQVRFARKPYYVVLERPELELTSFFEKDLSKIGGKLENEKERYVRLGDIAEIGNGMVSGLDRAFQVTNPNKFSEKEKETFISVIKAFNLEQYYFKNATPYIFINEVENEEELKREYPNIYRHLLKYREKLEKRYNYDRDIPWWHWVFPRNQKLMENNHEKIFTPCKERIDTKGYARFAYVKGCYYATQDVTVIVKKPYFKEDTKYLLALLNSTVIFTWIKYKGLTRGGVVEFSERALSRIPIRLIDWDNPLEANIHERIVRLVENNLQIHQTEVCKESIEGYIRNLYGLTN